MLAPLLLGGGIYSLVQLSRANEWVTHTSDVRIALGELLSALLDAETGVRGYLLSGEKEFLAPYERAQSDWPGRLRRIRTLTADNPEQLRRLADLERLAGGRLQVLSKMRSQYDDGERGPPLIAAMHEGKNLMDELRALVAALQQEEIRQDKIRQRDAVDRWRSTLASFVLGAFVLFAVVLAAAVSRRRAQALQREAEELFFLMVESVRDYAIITLDSKGCVTTWNVGAEKIKGWRADEIIGQHFSKFYPAEEVQAGKCDRTLELVAREGRFEEESWRVRSDGSRFWANVVINAIRNDRGELVGFTKVTRDLTERKMAAEALADEYQRRTDAERETRFAQMFIGILGHDLRNPLNAISMAARLLRKKVGSADPKVLDRISSSTQRMSNMVDQLLDLTRSRLAGGIPVEQKPVDLCAMISAVVDELRLVHPTREIRWAPDGGYHCACDPDRMAQVLSNLIGNAIQHSEPSTPVTVRLAVNRDETAISVHNDGPPIPADLLPHIFEPYRRNSARSDRSEGLGLGLFISQQVVAAHGGRIDVRSTPDEGTTFTVTQPCTKRTELASTRDV